MKTFLKYFCISAYLTAVVFSFLAVKGLAQTSETETYRPPKGKVRHQNRKAGGSRGCKIPLNDAVTLLVPQNHTATTISDRPTFFWHLSQKLSRPLRFTLLEAGKNPILTQELNPEPGIVALKLPENSLPLTIGKTYRWTVTIICNPDKPSRNLFAQAWIKRVFVSKSNYFSENIPDKSDCSTKYAKLGIWYDSLACYYTKQKQDSDNLSNGMKEFWSLLKEIDLYPIAQEQPQLILY